MLFNIFELEIEVKSLKISFKIFLTNFKHKNNFSSFSSSLSNKGNHMVPKQKSKNKTRLLKDLPLMISQKKLSHPSLKISNLM
jgi:hypothetical protein